MTAPNTPPSPERSATVLVVDDNETNQALIRAVLEARQYNVQSALSAQELESAIAGGLPDLILMDVQLPGADGLELTRRLKATPATARVPVLALTAFAMPGDREKALEAGCDGYLSKPFRPRELVEAVSRGLEGSR